MALAVVANVGTVDLHAPTMLVVLALGIIARIVTPNLVSSGVDGIAFCANAVLRFGVALLGLRIMVSDLVALGPAAIVVVLSSVLMTVGGGYLIARLLGHPRDMSAVSATSVAICGASAALAAAAIAPRREGLERETALVIVGVSLLSTLAMVLYPSIAHVLRLDAESTALLLGGAIHDVAQVAGAGLAVSPDIGAQSVMIKMIRVACLLPVVSMFAWVLARGGVSDGSDSKPKAVPFFLVAFFLLAILASSGILPSPAINAGKDAATWMLTIAVGAIGLKTSIADLGAGRPGLLFAIVAQTTLQLFVVIILVKLI